MARSTSAQYRVLILLPSATRSCWFYSGSSCKIPQVATTRPFWMMFCRPGFWAMKKTVGVGPFGSNYSLFTISPIATSCPRWQAKLLELSDVFVATVVFAAVVFVAALVPLPLGVACSTVPCWHRKLAKRLNPVGRAAHRSSLFLEPTLTSFANLWKQLRNGAWRSGRSGRQSDQIDQAVDGLMLRCNVLGCRKGFPKLLWNRKSIRPSLPSRH